MIKINTDRLIIRDHKLSDLKDHHELISDDEVMTYIQDIQTHSLQASKDNLMFSIKESKNPDRSHYFFGIFDKVTDAHIGSIGFTFIEKATSGNVELGYFIHKKYWGKGYTFEAAEAIIDFAFNHLKVEKITTGCIYENAGSENIMKKLGMFKEAHKYRHTYLKGKWRDRVEYGLYNPMYLNRADKQWLIIVSLAARLQHLKYHFDGSTAAFVFGANVEMDDIDITFPYDQLNHIRAFFSDYDLSEVKTHEGMKHFHFYMDDEKIHCLFYPGHKEAFSYEDDIVVRYFTPIVYKSMSFYLTHCKNEALIKEIKGLMKDR